MNQQNNSQDSLFEEEPKVKKSNAKKTWFWILISIVSVILIVAITLTILVQMGKNSLLGHNNVTLETDNTVSDVEILEDNTVIYNDEKYVYNKNVTSVLCIGIDKFNFQSNTSGENGQADALFLAALDTKTGRSCIIPIPRDSMAEIDYYSQSGSYVGIRKSQICLAYAYGDGKHTSCENTAKAVSRMFYGIPIDSYIAIDMDAIGVLTQKVGGVEVVLPEDMEIQKRYYKKGSKITLSGDMALDFVMKRNDDITASLSRMARQRQFIGQFSAKAIEKTKKDITAPIGLFKAIMPYMVTDLDVADVSFLTSCFIGSKAGEKIEYKQILGEAKQPGEYVEYIYDQKSVYDIILDVYYNKVD
jgi:LCP family protein required for cell wall assembly